MKSALVEQARAHVPSPRGAAYAARGAGRRGDSNPRPFLSRGRYRTEKLDVYLVRRRADTKSSAGQGTIPSGADRRRRTRYAAELVDVRHVLPPVLGYTWALPSRPYRMATACTAGFARVSFRAAPRVRAETPKLRKPFWCDFKTILLGGGTGELY